MLLFRCLWSASRHACSCVMCLTSPESSAKQSSWSFGCVVSRSGRLVGLRQFLAERRANRGVCHFVASGFRSGRDFLSSSRFPVAHRAKACSNSLFVVWNACLASFDISNLNVPTCSLMEDDDQQRITAMSDTQFLKLKPSQTLSVRSPNPSFQSLLQREVVSGDHQIF